MDAEILDRLLRVNMFVELNDDEAYYNELSAALQDVRSHMTPQQIAKNVPHAMSYFLVLHGMFHYQGGDFWQNFLQLDANHKTVWSKQFIETLTKYGMPRFDALIADQTALPYITRFLMHGGIPRHSLPDYFREFLTKYIRALKRTNIPLMQYKQEWLEQPHAIDRPVVRFLEYGGTFANDWVERTVQMAMVVDEYIKRNKSVAFLSQAVLREARVPIWVTQSYWEYRKTTRAVDVRTQEINPPRLSLLHEQTVVIDLPTQELQIGVDNAMTWVFTYGAGGLTTTDTVPVFAHIRGHLLHVEASAKELAYRADVFDLQIALHRGQEVIRTWNFPAELLVFRLIRSQYVYKRGEFKIPGTVVQLLTKQPVALLVDGVDVEPDTDGESWLYTIDGTTCQEVKCDGQNVPFVESDEDLGPQLIDGQKIALKQPIDCAHVYEILPNIHIPLSRNSAQADQAMHWRLVITNETTEEIVQSRTRLSEITAAMEWRERSFLVTLSALRMSLSPGLYRIELSSETQSARLFFYYMPGFVIASQSDVIVPIVATTKPQIIISAVPDGWRLDHENQRTTADGKLLLSYPEGTESGSILLRSGMVELTIPVVFPHIHVIMFDKTGTELAIDTVYQQDAVWYQENQPVIEARLSPWNAPDIADLRVSVDVEVAQNDVTQTLAVRSNAARRWFVADTAAANDTIMHSIGGNAQAIIQIESPTFSYSHSILTLQKMVNVENLRLSWAPVLDNFRITAEWDAPESPSNWRMVFWSVQRPWQNIDVRPIPAGRTDAKYIVTPDDFRAGETYRVGIVSFNRNNSTDDRQQRGSSGAPAFPPESNGYALLTVPGERRTRNAEDLIAALFTGVQPNVELLQQLYAMPRSTDEICIKVVYRLLVRIHQAVVQMQREGNLVNIQEVFEREIRSSMVRFYDANRFCFLIAVLKLSLTMRQGTLFDRELVQYLASLVGQDLFDVMLKAEIRGGVAESHIAAFLQRSLETSDFLRLRAHGIFLVEEYDESFVPLGITDSVYWHGILREMVNPTWLDAMNASQEISYEDAVYATSLIRRNPASQFDLEQRKNDRIRAWRDRLMPVIQVWLIRTAIIERRPLKMPVAIWWDNSGAESVLRKLNSYTPERGDLRDYLMTVLP
jgi:hypothetical protein